MLLSQNIVENTVTKTSTYISSILTSNKGNREKTLKIDGMEFSTIVAMQILVPIFVAITSTVISSKLIDRSKSLEELNNQLKTLIGKSVLPIDDNLKKQLVEIVTNNISKYGASQTQAKELVELILSKIENEKDI